MNYSTIVYNNITTVKNISSLFFDTLYSEFNKDNNINGNSQIDLSTLLVYWNNPIVNPTSTTAINTVISNSSSTQTTPYANGNCVNIAGICFCGNSKKPKIC